MKKKSISFTRLFPALLVCLFCLIPTASANSGPRPELTITVINAPEGELYLDLLAEGEPGSPHYDAKLENYDPAILSSLRSLEGDGWVLAYSTGLASSREIIGRLRPAYGSTWSFSYLGLPETFRVAAATADAAQAVEVPYRSMDMFAYLVYDWEANTLRGAATPPLRFLARLASTLIPTLLIEGALFWLFGFREKRSWLVFLLINLVTQVGMHRIFGVFIPKSGDYLIDYLLIFIPSEVVIFAIEATAYRLLLREKEPGRRVRYALLANVTSAALGYFPLHLLHDVLMRM